MNVALPDLAGLTIDQKRTLFHKLIQDFSADTNHVQFEDGSAALIIDSIEQRKQRSEAFARKMTPQEISDLERLANAPDSEFFTAEEFLEEMRLAEINAKNHHL